MVVPQPERDSYRGGSNGELAIDADFLAPARSGAWHYPEHGPASPSAIYDWPAREYGPILRLHVPGWQMIVVSSQELVNDACDERWFDKYMHLELRQVRNFTGDRLLTGYTH